MKTSKYTEEQVAFALRQAETLSSIDLLRPTAYVGATQIERPIESRRS